MDLDAMQSVSCLNVVYEAVKMTVLGGRATVPADSCTGCLASTGQVDWLHHGWRLQLSSKPGKGWQDMHRQVL